MRVVTWNVGHQTRVKDLPASTAAALGALAPDVIVLTEYVEAESHGPFIDALAGLGLKHPMRSPQVLGENQVLIAAREELAAGAIACTAGLSPSTAPNWLHVCMKGGVELVGLRRPMFKGVARGIRQYWSWVADATAPLLDRPAILIGDFNCGAQARCLDAPKSRGWVVATPASGWSFRGKSGAESAIDHALVTPYIEIGAVRYCPSLPHYDFAGSQNSYSDHAPLVVDVRPKHHTPAS